MMIQTLVTECDITGARYDRPVSGGGFIAQGATGRWCVVLHVGPEAILEHNYQAITYDEAVRQAEAIGGWADF